MKIPFSPPYIDSDIENEVLDTLRSGWITTGPKVRDLEILCNEVLEVEKSICVNSWTSGALLVLKWLGIGKGDEVIVPAYTYAATALVVLHSGATPVMVDVLEDFTINPEAVRKAVTDKTKAILAVDIAGWPCDYNQLKKIVEDESVTSLFKPANLVQEKFSRIALISDAAHSLGAKFGKKSAALACDITIYSLHAVKNVTTAEGGVICLNLPPGFSNSEVYEWMKLNSLNGQTKDAFSKSLVGGWKYDIISDGMKINMPDVCAAIGLAQLRKYPNLLLPQRRRVFQHYSEFFKQRSWAQLPPDDNEERVSSCHLYPLRFFGITEQQRDAIIQKVAEAGVAVNVHFIPMPMLSLFKSLGYDIVNYPVAYSNYSREISLPIYPQLSDLECSYIEEQIEEAYKTVVA